MCVHCVCQFWGPSSGPSICGRPWPRRQLVRPTGVGASHPTQKFLQSPHTTNVSCLLGSKMPKLIIDAAAAPFIVEPTEIWTVFDRGEDIEALFRAELPNMTRACLYTLSGWYL